MSAILMDIGAFESELRAGKLVLTANNRQRNQILRAYNSTQTEAVWRAPRVQTLRQWQEVCWQAYQLAGLPSADLTLQTNTQRDILWREVVQQYATAQQLLQPGRLVTHAEAARMALDAWDCPIETIQQWQHEDTDLTNYSNWYLAYHEKLQSLRLATTEIIQSLLIEAFNRRWIEPEQSALLYGFDDLNPLAERLIRSALPSARTVETPSLDTKARLIAYDDSDDEVLQAALWADQVLTEQPQAVIGIVVPNLGQIRARVESLFQSVFTPLESLPSQTTAVAPYNFSAGTPLASCPVIDGVLSLVTGLQKKHTLESACEFLLNVYVGDSQAEWLVRAQAVDTLRHYAKLHYSLTDIREALALACNRTSKNAKIYTALQTLAGEPRHWQRQNPVEHWRQELVKLLENFGWPGPRQLSSIEYQQVAQFYELLNELDGMAKVQPVCSFWDYCERLAETLRHAPFQAQTPDSPIQILGVLEAAGLQFSHLRIVGMHHGAWPPAAAPNPLLPIPLQRDWGMPKSSSERELNYAVRLTERMTGSAQDVIFSYPKTDGDRRLQASRLVENLCHDNIQANAIRQPQTSLLQSNYERVATSGILEVVDCTHAPKLDCDQLPGGTGIIKAQANCPFTAFARFRLGARCYDKPSLGFSALERGNALHQVMANFWEQVQSNANLLKLSEEEIIAILQPLVKQALLDLCGKSSRPFGQNHIDLEQERLLSLLACWAKQEKMRPEFSVTAIEQRIEITLNGYLLNVQVDRIDTLADGSTFIIDYKTGNTSTNDWKQGRLFDPQLPLYACTILPDRNAGIAFATINGNNQCFNGWGDNVAIDGVKAPEQQSWHQQLDVWQQELSRLASEIRCGYAPVDYRGVNAQRFEEDLKPLNRWDEQNELERWSIQQQ
ncbi:PD-(D/E)XK nuclease family protein [Gilvimarinus sp. SDUM040013]|uniref:PD-(D/E)XK nuclease family protein n=1 Tax=Gilvimarinus gilvus TaxID=3058038 RepID=A0ABU4RU10_9GAMM|nr:PD-(D/E)XK nuclease family protein [Gilvimarinus sp. SDUM040013]MDO3384987.1 PD-(D/E)XK nuclease family protein [Gilvimarinus sp. SDUM040013]MDX6848362.1 PD-(D/E)XK nuclease family protein [Gilvimarinus sp. SDUM040013]